jgi:hypothetical protein
MVVCCCCMFLLECFFVLFCLVSLVDEIFSLHACLLVQQPTTDFTKMHFIRTQAALVFTLSLAVICAVASLADILDVLTTLPSRLSRFLP